MNDLRVYLIDDHSMIRAGFRSLLQARDGIEFQPMIHEAPRAGTA